jgi:hypothetical protein
VARDIEDTKALVSKAHDNVRYIISQQQQSNMHTWLSPPDPSTNYNKALEARHKDSGQWFLESPEYASWRAQPNSFLWLNGKPGCGKTILSSTIIEDLRKSSSRAGILLYFYFDFNATAKQSLENMVRSLIYQLYREMPDTQKYLESLYASCDRGKSQPPIDKLYVIFQQMVESAGDMHIILDALDECPDQERKRLLAWIKNLYYGKKDVRLLTTSRPEQDIKSSMEWARPTDFIPLQSSLVHADICQYIHARVHKDQALARWRGSLEIQTEIESALEKKADGM